MLIAEKIDSDLKLPRVNKKQTHQANYDTNDLQGFYRQSIFIPILEYVVEDLKARFSKNTLEVHNLFIFIPPHNVKNINSDFSDAVLNISKKYFLFFLQRF